MGPGASVMGASGPVSVPSALAPPPQAKWDHITTTTADDWVAYHTRLLNHTINTMVNNTMVNHTFNMVTSMATSTMVKDQLVDLTDAGQMRKASHTFANKVVAQPVDQLRSCNSYLGNQNVATTKSTTKKVEFVDLCDSGD